MIASSYILLPQERHNPTIPSNVGYPQAVLPQAAYAKLSDMFICRAGQNHVSPQLSCTAFYR